MRIQPLATSTPAATLAVIFLLLSAALVVRAQSDTSSLTKCGGGHFQDGLCSGQACKCYQPELKTAVLIQSSTTSNVDTKLLLSGVQQAAEEARIAVRYVNVRGDGDAAMTEVSASTEDIVIVETTHFGPSAIAALQAAPRKSSTYAVGKLNTVVSENVIAAVGSNATNLGIAAVTALAPPATSHVVCVTRLAAFNTLYDDVCSGVQKAHATSATRTFQKVAIDAFAGTNTADADFTTMYNAIPAAARSNLYFVAIGDLTTQTLLRQTTYSTPPSIAVVRPGADEVASFDNPAAASPSASWMKALIDDSPYSQGYSVFHTAAFYHRTANVMATNQFEFGPYVYTSRSQLPSRWQCALLARDYVMCDATSAASVAAGCSCINRTDSLHLAMNWVTDPDSIQFFINTRYGLLQWWDALKPNAPALDERWPPAFDEAAIIELIRLQTLEKPDGLLVVVFSKPMTETILPWLANVTYTNTYNVRTPELAAAGHSGTHFGTSEYDGGLKLGQAIRAKGATRAVCSLHIANWAEGNLRCAGVAAAFPPGQVYNVRTTHASSPGVLKSQVKAILDNDTAINGWVALDADNGAVISDAFTERGVQYPLAAFDWSARLAEKIAVGNATAAAHQLNVAYTYISSMYLTLAALTDQRLMNDWVKSGPNVITKDTMGPFLCEDAGYPICDVPVVNNGGSSQIIVELASSKDHTAAIASGVIVPIVVIGGGIVAFLVISRMLKVANAPKDVSKFQALFVQLKRETLLWERMGIAMPKLIKEYHSISAKAAKKNGCYVVKHIGGATLIVANTAEQILGCAADLNHDLQEKQWPQLSAFERDASSKKGGGASSIGSRRSARSSVHGSKRAKTKPKLASGPTSGHETPTGSHQGSQQSGQTGGGHGNDVAFSIGIHFDKGVSDYQEDRHSYDYSGPAVDGAAVAADKAQGDQILLTQKVDQSPVDKACFIEYCTCEWGKDTILHQFNVPGMPARSFSTDDEDEEANVDSIAAALEQASSGVTTKRIVVASVYLHSIAEKSKSMPHNTFARYYSEKLTAIQEIVAGQKGHINSIFGPRLTISFNAASPTPQSTLRATTAVERIREHESIDGSEISAGIAADMSLVGSFILENWKIEAVISKVGDVAVLLQQMCEKYEDTHCLAQPSMYDELNCFTVIEYVDLVRLPDAVKPRLIISIHSFKEETDNDEWMYELENAASGNPYYGCNEVFDKAVNLREPVESLQTLLQALPDGANEFCGHKNATKLIECLAKAEGDHDAAVEQFLATKKGV